MIQPERHELAALADLPDSVVQYLERLRASFDEQLRNTFDATLMRQHQGWAQAITHILELNRNGHMMLRDKAEKAAMAHHTNARF